MPPAQHLTVLRICSKQNLSLVGENPNALSRQFRDARVYYGHTTSATHAMSTPVLRRHVVLFTPGSMHVHVAVQEAGAS